MCTLILRIIALTWTCSLLSQNLCSWKHFASVDSRISHSLRVTAATQLVMPKWMRQLLWNEPVIVPQMEFEHIKEQVRSSRKLSLNVLNQCKKPKVENSLQLHVAPVEPENMKPVLSQPGSTPKKTMSLLRHELWKCNQIYHTIQLWTVTTILVYGEYLLVCIYKVSFMYC